MSTKTAPKSGYDVMCKQRTVRVMFGILPKLDEPPGLLIYYISVASIVHFSLGLYRAFEHAPAYFHFTVDEMSMHMSSSFNLSYINEIQRNNS